MDDQQYIKELESRCLKMVAKIERLTETLKRVQTREENLESALQILRGTKSTIPSWVRELARAALDVASTHRERD